MQVFKTTINIARAMIFGTGHKHYFSTGWLIGIYYPPKRPVLKVPLNGFAPKKLKKSRNGRDVPAHARVRRAQVTSDANFTDNMCVRDPWESNS